MIGLHAQLFRDVVPHQGPQFLASLAVQAVPLPGQAISPLPFPSIDGPEIVKDYMIWPVYTACHNVAEQVNIILGQNVAPVIATNAPGRALAVNALGGNNVIWMQYAQHSITLIASNNTVQSIEAWAGSRPGTPNAVIVLPFHECIFDRLEEIDITPGQAAAAIADVQNPHKPTRSAAWDVLCRAGGADAFEKGTADRTLTVTVRPLEQLLRIDLKLSKLADQSRRWLLRYSKETLQLPYCCTCWRQHGRVWSTWFGRWHWCSHCMKSYCDACGAGMQKPPGKPDARTRRCVPCNNETELID